MVMLADYTMYVVLVTTGPAFSSDFGTKGRKDQYLNAIPEFGRAPEDKIQPKIEGNSSMASLARSLLALSNPLKDIAFDVDASVCRPKASPPSTLHNGLIGAAIIGMLTTIIFQVYVMRLRHVILGWYYPQRETDRAGWLRAYIRNSRGLFSRLVHRFRTRDLNTKRGQARLPFFERYLLTHPDTLWLLGFVGVERVYCVYCGDYGKPNKKVEFEEKFIQCSDCGAYYCLSCQVDLKHICMNCRIPLKILKVEVDLEKMSSEEELEYFCGKYLKRAPHENFRVPPEELDYETMMREYEKMWKSWREANAARMNQQEDLSSEGSSEESNTEMDAPGSVIEDRYIGQPVDVTKPFPIASTHKEMPDKGVEAQSAKTNNDMPPRALPLPSYSKAMTPSGHSVSDQNVPAHVELANISFPITSPHTEIPDKGIEGQSGKTNDNIRPRSLHLPSYSKAMTPSEHSVSSQNVPAHVEPANIVDAVASPHTEMPDIGDEAQSGKTNDNIPPRSLPLPSYSKAVTPGERSVSDQKAPVCVDSPNRLSNDSKRDKNAGTRVSVASILSSGVSEHVIEKPYAAHVTTIEPKTSKIYENPQRPASQAPVIKKEFSSLSTDIARAPETNRRLSKRKEKYAVHAESGRQRKRSQMGSSNEERDKKPPSSQQKRVENKEITNTFTVRGGMPETGSQHTRKVPISSELPPIEHRNTLSKKDKRLLKLDDRAKKVSEKDFDENDMEVDNAFEDPMLDLELPELDRKRTAGRTERDTERDFKVTSVFDENDMEVDTAMQDSALMRAIESDGFYDKKLSRTRSRVTERKMRTAKSNQKGPQFDAVFDEDDMSVDDVMNDPRLFADVPDDGLFKEGISDSFLREDL
nr:unnamed protein product [Spirometra erinaceieuropaei]